MFSTITSKFPGTCRRCHESFPAGTRIRYGGHGRTYHLKSQCPGANIGADPMPESDPYPADERATRGEDTGRYVNGYRVYRDGTYREDFGADL